MQKIAQFFKVSKENYIQAIRGDFPAYDEAAAEKVYEELKLPMRATKGSAGYDFYAPFSFTLAPGETIKIPTGIRAKMEEGWVLQLFPRSGLGFKFRLQLNNTVGIIDSDYFDSDNEAYELLQEEFTPDKYDKIDAILEKLRDYTVKHFTDEEAYMESIQYKKIFTQKRRLDVGVCDGGCSLRS